MKIDIADLPRGYVAKFRQACKAIGTTPEKYLCLMIKNAVDSYEKGAADATAQAIESDDVKRSG